MNIHLLLYALYVRWYVQYCVIFCHVTASGRFFAHDLYCCIFRFWFDYAKSRPLYEGTRLQLYKYADIKVNICRTWNYFTWWIGLMFPGGITTERRTILFLRFVSRLQLPLLWNFYYICSSRIYHFKRERRQKGPLTLTQDPEIIWSQYISQYF